MATPVPVGCEPKEVRTRFVKPSVEEVAAFCVANGIGIDAAAFVAYYDSIGWKVGGKAPMKDWRAACRYWQTRRKQDSRPIPQVKKPATNIKDYY